MRFEHPLLPGRALRLAYCLNLVAAEDLAGVSAGLRSLVAPLARRLSAPGERFGVGLWLPAAAALELAAEGNEDALERFVEELEELELDAFTFNAFPYGGFHRAGLKERVFVPSWKAPERLAYTLAVARIALAAHAARDEHPRAHVSISTHAGAYAAAIAGAADLDAIAANIALAAVHLAQIESEHGLRIVLALEPEPRSTANDTGELVLVHERIRQQARVVIGRGFPSLVHLSEEIVGRHVGTCLDTCHAAVEYEEPKEALLNATRAGTPLGKLQFSSALSLARPDDHPAGRARLLALDEPVFLHQLTARRGDELVRAADLAEVAASLALDEPRFRGAEEWRCHFHVPVDLARLGEASLGLRTTTAEADAIFDAALSAPERWGTEELHVEVETYTWNVLPGDARGEGDRIDGLARELGHVEERLALRGWKRARRAEGEAARAR